MTHGRIASREWGTARSAAFDRSVAPGGLRVAVLCGDSPGENPGIEDRSKKVPPKWRK